MPRSAPSTGLPALLAMLCAIHAQPLHAAGDAVSLVQHVLKRDTGQANCTDIERAMIKQSMRAFALGRSIEESICHTAMEGEDCHRHVLWVMTQGYNSHPELYEFRGLRRNSTFEDYQSYLHTLGHASCARPCKAGMTVRSQEFREDVIFANLPPECMRNMTTPIGVNHSQFARCLQALLQISPQCADCGSRLFRSFAGADIFDMGCLPRCQPMAAACQVSDAAAVVPTGDCLRAAGVCLDCVKPAAASFHRCAGAAEDEQLEILDTGGASSSFF